MFNVMVDIGCEYRNLDGRWILRQRPKGGNTMRCGWDYNHTLTTTKSAEKLVYSVYSFKIVYVKVIHMCDSVFKYKT